MGFKKDCRDNVVTIRSDQHLSACMTAAFINGRVMGVPFRFSDLFLIDHNSQHFGRFPFSNHLNRCITCSGSHVKAI